MTRVHKHVLALAALSALAVTACGGGESAKPIVFSANQSSRATAADEAMAPGTTNSKMAVAPSTVEYVVEGELPALDDSAQSWRSIGEPTKKQMQAIVAALGIEDQIVARKQSEGGGYVAGPTDGSAPSVSFSVGSGGAFPQWNFSNAWASESSMSSPPATRSDAPSAANDSSSDSVVPSTEVVAPDTVPVPKNLPSKSEAREKVQKVLDAAGVEVRSEDFETYADDWGVSVTAWPHVGDLRVPLSWNFGFGDEGVITWASGSLLRFEKGPKFPRVGTKIGVERLSDPKYSGWGGYGIGGRIAKDAVASDVAPSDTGTSTDSVAPTVQKVTVAAVKESLTAIVDADGVTWLVPSYEFTMKDGYTLGVIAITDEFMTTSEPSVEPPSGIIEPAPAPATGGGSSGTSGSSSGSAGDSPAAGGDALALSQEEAVKLVGLTEDEATKVADANGWILRVTSRDGESFQVTMDFVTNRVNLAIVGGKVTGVSVG